MINVLNNGEKYNNSDIAIYHQNQLFIIEYDGDFWHDKENSVTKDINKTKLLEINSDAVIVRLRVKCKNKLDIIDRRVILL